MSLGSELEVAGSYSPDTKLWYTMTQDYCNIIEVKEKLNVSLKFIT